MDQKAHWEKIYSTKSYTEVSWFTEHIINSLELIHKTNIPQSAAVIDIGGGAASLVDDLLLEGFADITVMDISSAALAIAQARLKEKSAKIHWLEADILTSDLNSRKYDLWHDRAVFHFLNTEKERGAYRNQVNRFLKPQGFLVMSIFAEDGPLKCNTLEIKRHSAEELQEFFGDQFNTLFMSKTVHMTPSKSEQKFVNLILQRK